MADQLSLRLVPDELWDLVRPHLPTFRSRPQGGGTAPLPDRQVFTAIVYVLTGGCARRDLPPPSGVPFQTAHRRFAQWTKAGAWPKIHRTLLDELGSQGLIDWSRAIAGAACVRAKKTSQNPWAASQPCRG